MMYKNYLIIAQQLQHLPSVQEAGAAGSPKIVQGVPRLIEERKVSLVQYSREEMKMQGHRMGRPEK